MGHFTGTCREISNTGNTKCRQVPCGLAYILYFLYCLREEFGHQNLVAEVAGVIDTTQTPELLDGRE